MDDDMLAPALKSALRNLVRSVVVVTAQHEGRPYAMAATAVSEVSMDPPSMLVCINRDAAIFQAIDAGSDLVLNVLGSDHEAVSRACGVIQSVVQAGASWVTTRPSTPCCRNVAVTSSAIWSTPAHRTRGRRIWRRRSSCRRRRMVRRRG